MEKNNPYYDVLDSWRESVGIPNSNGDVKHYEGNCEYDTTAEAIREYMLEQESNLINDND